MAGNQLLGLTVVVPVENSELGKFCVPLSIVEECLWLLNLIKQNN